jgi:hypothetical protein
MNLDPSDHQYQHQNQHLYSKQREVAIFWDYENVPLPGQFSSAAAAKAIVNAVSPYGRIVDRRLYYNFENFMNGPRDPSSLDSSGFDLVNTPTRNQKESLDKKMIADILTFAWDMSVRGELKKPCVVLLTSDGDYAYTISKLRDRGVMTVVMLGKSCSVAKILVDCADVALSLEDDVLKPLQDEKDAAKIQSKSSRPEDSISIPVTSSRPRASTTSTYSRRSRNPQPRDSTPSSSFRSSKSPQPRDTTSVRSGRSKSPSPVSTKTYSSSNDDKVDDSELITNLCKFIVMLTIDDCTSNDDSGWAELGSVLKYLQNKIQKTDKALKPLVVKEQAKALRHQAENQGLIETGWRRASRKGARDVTVFSNNLDSSLYTRERYVRLRSKGKTLVGDSRRSDGGSRTIARMPSKSEDDASSTTSFPPSTKVFLRGIPRKAKVKELVDFFQTVYHATVRRARIVCMESDEFSRAHFEFFRVDDASTLLRESNRTNGGKGVFFRNQAIWIGSDKFPKGIELKGNDGDDRYYESERMSSISNMAMPTNNDSNDSGDDTSKDVALLCLSLYLEEVTAGEDAGVSSWINCSQSAERFRSKLPQTYLKTAPKDEATQRAKSARTDAETGGFIQLGRRRKIDANGRIPIYVVVGLNAKRTDESKLSSELYVRLRPLGRNIAIETRSLLQEAPPKTNRNGTHKTLSNINLFMRNVPLAANAKQFVEFLESTLSCSVQWLVLLESTWSGKPAKSAHMRFSSDEDGSEVLRAIKSRPNGLVYCGQCIDAVTDLDPRNAPKYISHKSYIKDEVDKTPSLTGFLWNPTLPNNLGSVDNQFIDNYGTTASLDSAVERNDFESVSDVGSVTTPEADDIAENQFEDEFEDKIWAGMSL